MAEPIRTDWPTRKLVVSPPPLEDLVPTIQQGLEANFKTVSVKVEAPPDLRKPPFYLAAPGLSGNTRIADVGGPEYVEPLPDRSKRYDFLSLAKTMEMSPERGIILGAGAGPLHVLNTNTEYMPNLAYEKNTGSRPEILRNESRYVKVNNEGEVVLESIGNAVTDFALLINIFGADGLEGPLLHIKTKSRMGTKNFPEAVQSGLKSVFGDRLISIGGVFVISRGKANLHAMAHSTDQPFKGKIDHPWLRSFDTGSPLVGLTVFHSGDDQGTHLRREHTHCFAVEGDKLGGHYHWDIDETRDEVEYEAWLNTAEFVFRVDQPGL